MLILLWIWLKLGGYVSRTIELYKHYILLELKLFFREWQYPFFTFIYPILMIVIFGSIFGNNKIQGINELGYIDLAVSGYIGIVIAVSGSLNLTSKLAYYRDISLYHNFYFTPLNKNVINISIIITNTLMSLTSIIILIIFSFFLYDLIIPNVPMLLLFLVISSLLMYTFSLFVITLFKDAKAAVTINFLIFFVMLFLSGASIPLEIFPDNLVLLSSVLPLFYVVDLLKSLWTESTINSAVFNAGIMILLITVFLLLTNIIAKKRKHL